MGLVQPTQPSDIDLRPDASVGVLPDYSVLRMVCGVWIAGVRLLLMLGGPAPFLPATAWWIVDPQSSELCGPDYMWMSFGAQAATATRKRTPRPVPEPVAGRASRLPSDRPGMRMYVQPDAQADAGSRAHRHHVRR